MEERQSPLEPDWAKIDAMQASIEMTALVIGRTGGAVGYGSGNDG